MQQLSVSIVFGLDLPVDLSELIPASMLLCRHSRQVIGYS